MMHDEPNGERNGFSNVACFAAQLEGISADSSMPTYY